MTILKKLITSPRLQNTAVLLKKTPNKSILNFLLTGHSSSYPHCLPLPCNRLWSASQGWWCSGQLEDCRSTHQHISKNRLREQCFSFPSLSRMLLAHLPWVASLWSSLYSCSQRELRFADGEHPVLLRHLMLQSMMVLLKSSLLYGSGMTYFGNVQNSCQRAIKNTNCAMLYWLQHGIKVFFKIYHLISIFLIHFA